MVYIWVAEQVFLDEPAWVEVVEVEIGELRAEALPQVGLGSFCDSPQVAQDAAGLGCEFRQLIGAEHDQRDYGQDQQLGQG